MLHHSAGILLCPIRIKLLIADTGSGHRACGEALAEALKALNPKAEIELVDVLGEGGGIGSTMPELYRWMGRHPKVWGAMWHLLNGRRRRHLMFEAGYLQSRAAYRRLVTQGDPDLVVVMHPVMTTCTRRLLSDLREQVRLCTVVTDPVTGHASWYDAGMDLCVVSTEHAKERALELGVAEEALRVVGHPIHLRIAGLAAQRDALRSRYGWDEQVIVCTGGGEGELGLEAAVLAAARENPEARVVAVCGRNAALRERLVGTAGVEALGFVDDLPERMAAADVVLAKAGPSTLAEARAVGTPVVVYDYMPGQEEGNLDWATKDGAGTVALGTEAAGVASAGWLADEVSRRELREQAVDNAEGPSPAERIAALLLATLEARA